MTPAGRACLAEAIGTFALCFVGAGAIILDQKTGGGVGLLGIALAHGLILSAMISATGHISGAHFNPAVTIGFMVTHKTRGGTGIAYIVSQLAGGTVAGLLLRILFTADIWQPVNLGTPTLASDVSFGIGVLIEIIITFLLVTVIWGSAVDDRHPDVGGIAIGLTVSANILMGGPLTGAAMNPARTFGTALAGGGFDGINHLVYWIGPVIGGIAAALLYNNVLIRKD